MQKSFIVYGPQACGKSLFSRDLAAHLGVSKIVDDGSVTIRQYHDNPNDTLFLTNERPAWASDDDRRVLDFYELLQPAGLLYDPRLIERGAMDGQFFHPHLPAYEDESREEEDITPLVTAQGFAIATVTPDTEIDSMADDFWEQLKAWEPSPPDDSGTWRLAAILDTEDGARAWYVRPLNPVNQNDHE